MMPSETNSENKTNCNDCQFCLEVLHAVLDEEATLEQKCFFYSHIAQCVHCLDCYEVDKSIQETIKFKIAKMQVPGDLADCIKSKINETTLKA